MKKLHLLCNAHIDPAWLWKSEEGIAAAISTFRSAADFCEEYDGFVFNHNEALLYQWVEENEPALFERIKKLVSKGKWHIIGGWYLQPDCVMPSGESLISQIELGREYFLEKFGKAPISAMNVDSFGHSRGLVQILKEAGYESYLFVRPHHIYKDTFIWEGYDGSRIIAHGADIYATVDGKAAQRISKFAEDNKEKNVGLCLWGVGNHGGGPSRKDIEDIGALMEKSQKEGITILHSDMESFIKDVDSRDLPVVSASLVPAMVGCYTSLCRIKQANRRLESAIATAEKLMCYAEAGGAKPDWQALKNAKCALAYTQFHDLLPGSCVKPVEEETLCALGYAEHIVEGVTNRAFFSLAAGQKKCEDGKIPVIVSNPHPYEVEADLTFEFTMKMQNRNYGTWTFARVCDELGNEYPSQTEKPECTFNMDWVKKVAFRAKLAPSSISRFNCELKVMSESEIPPINDQGELVSVDNGRMKISVSRKDGLINGYSVDGKTYINRGGVLEMYEDDEDPWGMLSEHRGKSPAEFTLASDATASEIRGYKNEIHPNVKITEDGEVRTIVQAIFTAARSSAVVEYILPKHGTGFDVKITLHSQDANKLIRYKLETELFGTPYGEAAFGEEKMNVDGTESVFHKWCGIRAEDGEMYVINNGIYGGKFSESTIELDLLRTPIYACHPIADRQLAPHDRYIPHSDIGERSFSFRIIAGEPVPREAQIFNEPPKLLSFFPSGEGSAPVHKLSVYPEQVLVTSLKKTDEGYVARLHNSSNTPCTATVSSDFGASRKQKYKLRPFEIKKVLL